MHFADGASKWVQICNRLDSPWTPVGDLRDISLADSSTPSTVTELLMYCIHWKSWSTFRDVSALKIAHIELCSTVKHQHNKSFITFSIMSNYFMTIFMWQNVLWNLPILIWEESCILNFGHILYISPFEVLWLKYYCPMIYYFT